MKRYQKSIFIALFFAGLMGVSSCTPKEEPTPPEQITPQTPTGLEALAQSAEQIQLTWIDNSDNEANFQVERSQNDNQNFEKIATINQNSTSYKDGKLTPNTVYVYRIQAVTSAGIRSEYSNEANAQTESNLDKPMGLRAEAKSAFEIQLFWLDNNEKETAYKVERSVKDELNYKEIAILDSDITNYKDTDVEEKTMYFYRIQAVNLIGISEYSDAVAVETPQDVPDTPINFTAVPISTTEMALNWDDISDNESFFELERSTDVPENFEKIRTLAANTTTFVDKNLQSATTYYYRLRARRGVDIYSAYTEIVKAQTNLRPPAAPSVLDAKAISQTSIQLTWIDNADNEAGFRIFRRKGLSSEFEQIAQTNTNITKYEDTNLEPNTYYYYQIKAFNSGGESAFSQADGAQTPDFPPNTPSNLTATTISGFIVDLAWQNNATNVDKFSIEQSEDNATFIQIAEVANAVAKITNLKPNRTYYFRVKAINEAGESGYTNVASAKTLQVIPNAPTNIGVAPVSGSRLRITWQDKSDTEDAFIIYRSDSFSGTYNEIGRTAQNVTEYLNTGLKTNARYYYKVSAYNEAGESALSNIASGQTSNGNPTTPTLVNLNAVALGKVEVTFQETSLDATKIILEISEQNSSNFVEYAQFESTGATQIQTVTNLKGKTLYFFRIKAINGSLSSSYSQVLSITTTDAPPVIPSEFTARATSSSSIALNWKDNSTDETGFLLERSLNGVAFIELANLGTNIITYNDNGLFGNVTYVYRLRAYNSVGNSNYTEIASAQTPIEGAPLAPSNLTLNGVENPISIQISWADNSTNETGFRVERRTESGSYQIIANLGTDVRVYTDINISGNTKYYYRVKAFNNTADSPATPEKSITVASIPNSPFGVTGSYSENPHTVKLTWQMLNYEIIKANGTLKGFKIERSESSNQNFVLLHTMDEKTLTYTDTNLRGSTIYYYRVKAYNDKGDSSPSSEWAIQTQ